MKSLLLILLFIPFANFAQKITDSAEYHELLTLVQSNTSQEFYAISVMAKEGTVSPQEMKEYKQLLIEMIQRDTKDLQEIGGFNGDDNWSKATVELLKFYEKMAVNNYDRLVSFFSSNTKDLKLPEDLQKMMEEEDSLTTAFVTAEQAFAKKYGISIESGE